MGVFGEGRELCREKSISASLIGSSRRAIAWAGDEMDEMDEEKLGTKANDDNLLLFSTRRQNYNSNSLNREKQR